MTLYSGNDFIGNDPQRSCGIDNALVVEVSANHNYWAGAADFGVSGQVASTAQGPLLMSSR